MTEMQTELVTILAQIQPQLDLLREGSDRVRTRLESAPPGPERESLDRSHIAYLVAAAQLRLQALQVAHAVQRGNLEMLASMQVRGGSSR